MLFENGKYVNSPSGMAATMNKFLIEKSKKLRKSIPVVEADPLSKLQESMRNRVCTFRLKLVTKEEVLNIITSLNNSSSTGVDFIDTQTLKSVKEEIDGALTKIINLSIQTS